MPRHLVDLHVLLEVEAVDVWNAQDKVRDLLVNDEVKKCGVVEIKAVKWEDQP